MHERLSAYRLPRRVRRHRSEKPQLMAPHPVSPYQTIILTMDEVIYEGVSNCCDAKMYANTDICSECKEHCITQERQDEIQEETTSMEEKLANII